MSWFTNLLVSVLSRKGASDSRSFLKDQAGSLLNKYTGAGLTGAEQEANQFTVEQMDLANQRNVFNYQNRYQWEIADMEKAGLNPALLYGGSSGAGSVGSASAGSSVSPSGNGLSDLIGSIMNIALLKAQKENIDADTRLKDSESTGKDIENEFKPALLTQDLAKGKVDIRNAEAGIYLARANIERAMSEISVNKSVIELNAAEIKEVLSRASKEEIEAANELLRRQGIEYDNQAKAEQIILMRTQESLNIASAALAQANYDKSVAETGLVNLNAYDAKYDILWKEKYGSKPDANIASKAMTLIQKAATHKPDWKGFARNLGLIK